MLRGLSVVYARLHDWPHHRIGKLIRFSRANLEACHLRNGLKEKPLPR